MIRQNGDLTSGSRDIDVFRNDEGLKRLLSQLLGEQPTTNAPVSPNRGVQTRWEETPIATTHAGVKVSRIRIVDKLGEDLFVDHLIKKVYLCLEGRWVRGGGLCSDPSQDPAQFQSTVLKYASKYCQVPRSIEFPGEPQGIILLEDLGSDSLERRLREPNKYKVDAMIASTFSELTKFHDAMGLIREVIEKKYPNNSRLYETDRTLRVNWGGYLQTLRSREPEEREKESLKQEVHPFAVLGYDMLKFMAGTGWIHGDPTGYHVLFPNMLDNEKNGAWLIDVSNIKSGARMRDFALLSIAPNMPSLENSLDIYTTINVMANRTSSLRNNNQFRYGLAAYHSSIRTAAKAQAMKWSPALPQFELEHPEYLDVSQYQKRAQEGLAILNAPKIKGRFFDQKHLDSLQALADYAFEKI